MRKFRKPANADDGRHADSHGIGFWEVRHELWLPERVSDWHKIRRVVNPDVLDAMHRWHGPWDDCWYCGKRPRAPLEAHHITGGSKGRSDEFCNLVMLCNNCHKLVQSNVALLPHVLFIKWRHDREHADWVRLNLLHGRWLPDLSFPGEVIEVPI